MKYQLFTYSDSAEESRPGIAVSDCLYDLRAILNNDSWKSLSDLLVDWDQAEPVLRSLARHLHAHATEAAQHILPEKIKFLPPITRCGAIYGAGANYRDHAEAMSRAMNLKPAPDAKKEGLKPWHFLKAGQATLSAHHQHVDFPADTSKLDWEAELAVIIGRKASKVPADIALDYVAGYTCANDLSARDHLVRDKLDGGSPFKMDWVSHKNFRGSCPLGPFVTPAEFVSTPEDLNIRLWLNGQLRQDSNTRNHIFSVADQISHLSQRLDLLPGDIILTGTPAGVGMETGTFLKPGDVVRVWIEGLGELETSFV